MRRATVTIGVGAIVAAGLMVALGNRNQNSVAIREKESHSVTRPEVREPAKRVLPTVLRDGAVSASQAGAPSPYDVEPLPKEEARRFFTEMESVFLSKAPSTLRPDALTPLLSRLNSRQARGVRTILDALATPPTTDKEVSTRLAMVDYLKYRMKWDPALRGEALSLATSPVPKDAPQRYRASAMADRAELVNGLARVDWEMASDAISRMGNATMKGLAAYEAFHGLLETGTPREVALAAVRKVAPEFRG